MVDPTPTSAPGAVDKVKAEAAVVEAKAQSIWAQIGAHPVAVVLVLGLAGVGVLHFVFGVL